MLILYRIRRKADGLYLSGFTSHWRRRSKKVRMTSRKRVGKKRIRGFGKKYKRKQKRHNARQTLRQIARAEARKRVRRKARISSRSKRGYGVDLRWGVKGRTWRDIVALGRTYKRCLDNTKEELEIVEFVLQESATLQGILLDGRIQFLK